MRSISCHTTLIDPYRAGVALGEGLAPLEPEAVVLCASIHLGRSPELLEGLADVIGDVPLLGTTGHGFYERSLCADVGAAALGFATSGAVRFHVRSATGLRDDPAGTATRCLESLDAAAPDARVTLFAADFRTDAQRLEEVLRARRVPSVGGLSCDDYRMQQVHQFAGREHLSDAFVAMSLEGDFQFDIRLAHHLHAVGRPGTVTAARGSVVSAIDGGGAMDFVRRQLGKPVLEQDLGTVCLSVTGATDAVPPSVGSSDAMVLRSLRADSVSTTDELQLYGAVAVGSRVQCCLARSSDLVDEVGSLATGLGDSLPFRPAAALIVSCAGRKNLLANRVDHEVAHLAEVLGGDVGIVGYPSSGEFGPVREDGALSATCFHNMTYVVLTLGDRR